MKRKLTYRIKPTADMCQFHGINEETKFETRFVNGEIVVSVLDEKEIAEQVIANMEKIANDCLDCAYFCETCDRCSIPDDEISDENLSHSRTERPNNHSSCNSLKMRICSR